MRQLHPGTQGILKEHVLPRLEQLANTALWLHFAEEAVAFERGLSPLRGLPMPAGSDELAESTEEPWTDGSCLELLARQPVSAPLSILALHIHCGLKLSHDELGSYADLL